MDDLPNSLTTAIEILWDVGSGLGGGVLVAVSIRGAIAGDVFIDCKWILSTRDCVSPPIRRVGSFCVELPFFNPCQPREQDNFEGYPVRFLANEYTHLDED